LHSGRDDGTLTAWPLVEGTDDTNALLNLRLGLLDGAGIVCNHAGGRRLSPSS
jgi:hypothetical protein